MSGPTVARALRDRLESIGQAEIERLGKKLRGLTDDERQMVDAITVDIIHAIAGMPERALSGEAPQPTVDALVQLFVL